MNDVLDPADTDSGRRSPAQLWAFQRNARTLASYAKHGFNPDGAAHDYGAAWSHESAIRLVRD